LKSNTIPALKYKECKVVAVHVDEVLKIIKKQGSPQRLM